PAALLSPDGQQALMLARLGLGDSAWRALQEADVEADDNALWASAFVLDRAGAWHLSHDILRRRLPWFRSFPPTGNLRKHWELAYPNPFGRLVDAAAKASGIEKYYLWAVMREESGFNPGIESFANAVGLMQLIVPTAQHMADKKDGRITAGRLTEPDLNVRLGARYVAYVRDDTGAVTPLWPAGYNAGSGALKRWLKERDRLPLDLFVEAIPFEEARGYTKRVAASWATYRYLYGGKQADPLPYVSQKTHGPPAPKKRAPKKRASKKRKPRKGRGKKTK
ncbi:MAG: lytic transglycosylase domain-containing protein, partial [Myxococcales bacterium]|nr:lytic transglycosylase domain-containing protein [Myxococcales bacterium]